MLPSSLYKISITLIINPENGGKIQTVFLIHVDGDIFNKILSKWVKECIKMFTHND